MALVVEIMGDLLSWVDRSLSSQVVDHSPRVDRKLPSIDRLDLHAATHAVRSSVLLKLYPPNVLQLLAHTPPSDI
jgi:hypothetical protein